MPGWGIGRLPREIPSTAAQLKSLEALHGVFDLYIWLAFRFEDSFPDRNVVELLRRECSDMIGKGLENISRQRRGTTAKAAHMHAISP